MEEMNLWEVTPGMCVETPTLTAYFFQRKTRLGAFKGG